MPSPSLLPVNIFDYRILSCYNIAMQKERITLISTVGLALLLAGCNVANSEPQPEPTSYSEPTKPAATATVTATFTATKTNTPSPSLIATQTETRRPTIVTKTATPTPLPTETKSPLPQLDGKSMEKAIPIVNETKITIKPGETIFAVVGRKGVKIDELKVVSFSGDHNQIITKMYSPESLNQLKEALAGRTEMPANVGALTYKEKLGGYEPYSGKTGSSDGFLIPFINRSSQVAEFTFSVKEKAAACAGNVSGTYWEGFWWTTCDPNWLGSNKK